MNLLSKSRLSKSAFHLFAHSGKHPIERSRFCQHRLSHMITLNIFTWKRFDFSLSLSFSLSLPLYLYLFLFFLFLPSICRLITVVIVRFDVLFICLPNNISFLIKSLSWFYLFNFHFLLWISDSITLFLNLFSLVTSKLQNCL